MKVLTTGLLAGLVSTALFGSTSNAANLLSTNPSFEMEGETFVGGPGPFVNDTSITGWRLTGVGDGGQYNYSQILGTNSGGGPAGGDGPNYAYDVRGIFETRDSSRPSIAAGTEYSFTILAASDHGGAPTNGRISIDWYADQTGYAPLDTSSLQISITNNDFDGFQTYSLTAVAPLGALYAGVKVDSTDQAGGNAGSLLFDAASLTAVPEPASALIALVAVPMLARRRRQS